MMRIISHAIVFVATFAFPVAANDAPKFCIVDVPFTENMPVAISSMRASPGFVRSLGNTVAPAVYGYGYVVGEPNQQAPKTIFWSLLDDRPGFGPAYDPEYRLNLFSSYAAGDGNDTIIAIGADPSNPDGAQLLMSKSGRRFTPVPLAQTRRERLRFVRWDDLRKRFVVEALRDIDKSQGRGSVEEVHYTVEASGLTEIPGNERYSHIVNAGPKGSRLTLQGGQLRYISAEDETQIVDPAMFSGLDFRGFRSLYDTGQNGWYFADGAGGDTAVRLDFSGETPKVIEKKIFLRSAGFASDTLNWILGFDEDHRKRYRADTVERDQQQLNTDCSNHSAAVNRLYSCDGRVFGDGRFERPSGYPGALRYLGESRKLKAPVFVGNSGDVVFHDGAAYHDIGNVGGDWLVFLADLKASNRAFIITPDTIFEIDGERAGANLRKINTGTINIDHFSRIYQLSAGTAPLLFTRTGVYTIESGQLTPIWQSGDTGGHIDITGHMVPASVEKWQGILFSVRSRKSNNFKLVTRNRDYCTAAQ